ncbi:hypothetical protein MYCTH_2295968 [Thermothelomyces thermophilus ATCC 42464]|uniref:Golgi apparatus membrane protein TVP38 n=1 Tax=Thermothelomyces thermophilus (strain ATCC 42464 / BCRC 31852 / DSM 1799) TaxID=573729 RepID=G2PZV6_THET4|nr:uncharacterized protein MYCTH_2295968 [Thermothelomyces thermophilus ATCC 42464]AEO53979.1 hypothetical protein MYCTH_2295968 [Thermothelomyces thermophilus ATCC 42464]
MPGPSPLEDDLFSDHQSPRPFASPPTIITTRPSSDNDEADDDYDGAARPDQDTRPAWAPLPHPTPAGARRLSSHRATGSIGSISTAAARQKQEEAAPFLATALAALSSLYAHYVRFYRSLPLYQRILLAVAGAAALATAVLFLAYGHAILSALGTAAQAWRAAAGGWGWLPVWLATAATAFPPLVGYSTCVTLAGFVYGFPLGWPVAATATVAGSAAAFLAVARGPLRARVHRLVGRDRRFVALAQTLRHDGLAVLVMIRLCPLPYSLSNGFLATVGSIDLGRFTLATAAATPKLLVHVFIGSRLALLAESGDKMSWGDRAVNYISMLVFGLIGFAVGVFIYRRTMARAAELAREAEAENGDPLLDGASGDLEQGVVAGDDLENGRMVDPDELDAAVLMDDDDISLWDTAGGDGYRDSWDDEPAGTGIGANGHANGGTNGAKK